MPETRAVAVVVVASATYWSDKPYTYSIPAGLEGSVLPGVRVVVPFGRGNRRSEGLVLSVGRESGGRTIKPIAIVLDAAPVLTDEQLKLAVWMRDRYFCTVFEAARAMLPAGLWYAVEPGYALCEGISKEQAYDLAGENDAERLVLDALFAHGGRCPTVDLERVFDGGLPRRAISSLLRKAVIVTDSREKRRTGDKHIRMVKLAVSAEDALTAAEKKERRAPVQSAVLRLLSSMERVSQSELCYFTGASAATVAALSKAGLVQCFSVETYRRPVYNSFEEKELPVLNREQQSVFDGIYAQCTGDKPSAALLYGVTGSGKTTVYIHLIQRLLQRGQSSLLLVPEIALTPQMIRIFSSYFGDRVAVLHSSLAVGERYDEWKRIRSGEAKVVIGTRSAVFAPCVDLGMVIIDEEQEHTYKSENSPRYHARDIAKFRCASHNALLLLGSATPDLDSRYRAESGLYQLYRLTGRFNQQELPSVEVVDMRCELRLGNGGDLSSRLLEEIRHNLERGEQTILFLNRRGTSSLVSCSECGYTYSCPNCSVNMTWHNARSRLMCHHCGHTQRLDDVCPECGGSLNHYGTGTQNLEAQLQEAFPGVEILRMDADAVTPAGSHEKLLSQFREKRIPILIGTQMVTKGLDFENVTLVGVVSADQLLYCGDYRAAERTFSLITQVVGRSGRGQKPGRAIIQTFTPDNQVVRLASAQDYDGFYASEIELRRLQYCPPFADVITMTASAMDESLVLRCCTYIRDLLKEKLSHRKDIRVLGPAPLPIVRVNNRFRYRVCIHGRYDKELRTLISGILIHCNTVKEFRGISVFADLNPME